MSNIQKLEQRIKDLEDAIIYANQLVQEGEGVRILYYESKSTQTENEKRLSKIIAELIK